MTSPVPCRLGGNHSFMRQDSGEVHCAISADETWRTETYRIEKCMWCDTIREIRHTTIYRATGNSSVPQEG